MNKFNKLISLIFLTLYLLACSKEIETGQEPSKIVKLYQIEEITTSENRRFPGRVIEDKKANLSFRISAPIEEIFVEEGEFVKEGQLLAKLDNRDYQLQYNAVKAQFEQISSEVARIEILFQKGNVSQNDYEKAISGLTQITAKYKSVENSLNDVNLTAPYDGFIQEIFFDKGEIIKAGLPVLSIISNNNFQIQCDIPAIVYVHRDKFKSYKLSLETSPNIDIPLQLVSIKHKSNLNSLYRVYFRPLESSKHNNKMAVGMDCEIVINYNLQTLQDENIVKVPMEAIVQSDKENFVWLCTNSPQDKFIARKRLINIIGIDESGLVMVSDGLEAGDQIIRAGLNELVDGQEVQPLKESSPTNYGDLL